MEIKKYSSYAQIERELAILKLEKEIHLQKLYFSIEKTKNGFSVQNLALGLVGYSKDFLANSYVKIFQIGIEYLINWIKNRKRGD